MNEISKLIYKYKKLIERKEFIISEISKNKDMLFVWFDNKERLKKIKRRLNYFEKRLNLTELKIIDNQEKLKEVQKDFVNENLGIKNDS